jgi:hypothetical protein
MKTEIRYGIGFFRLTKPFSVLLILMLQNENHDW